MAESEVLEKEDFKSQTNLSGLIDAAFPCLFGFFQAKG